MDESRENLEASSPKLSISTESVTSPDFNILSPLSKSRYGRTRKPKITEDFYDIDVIFESTKDFKKSPRLQQTKPKSLSPKKPTSTTIKPLLKKQDDFVHITGDDLFCPEPVIELPHSELNSKAIHNFFKIESGMSVLQNAAVNKDESRCKPLPTSLDLESVDVTQVLKIISAKTSDENFGLEAKSNVKPVLKTYSNKRKSYIKTGIVESFGLPDVPIFPLKHDKLTEPKRIKNLDVAPTESENDINLVDKKLLDTPWKIASMDAEIPDLNMLLHSSPDPYKQDSPTKLLNHSTSIFDDNIELETAVNTQQTLKHKRQPDVNVHSPTTNNVIKKKSVETTKLSDKKNDSNVPEPNRLLPKLKKIVETKILRNNSSKTVKKKNEAVTDEPQEQKQETKKSVTKSDSSDAEKTKLRKVKLVKDQQENADLTTSQHNVKSKSNRKIKENPSESNKKNERLSLTKNKVSQHEDVSLLVTSPLRKITKKRKRSISLQNFDNIDDVEDSTHVFKPRRGRSSGTLQFVEEVAPSTRKRLSKSAQAALRRDVQETPLDVPVGVKQELLEDVCSEDLPTNADKNKDSSVEYVPSSISVVRGRKKKNKDKIVKNVVPNEELKSIDTVEIKREIQDVSVGDLMWAKIGGHPFWPCIIAEEPSTNEFKKTYYSKNSSNYMYHVRFFGDKGRRSWVHSLSVFPFTSKFDLKNQFEQSKNKANFIVKPSALAKWKIAVKEAELQLTCTIEQRLEFFSQVLIANKSSSKLKRDFIALEVKEEQHDECEPEVVQEEGNVLKKGRSQSLPPNFREIKKQKRGKRNSKLDKNEKVIELDTADDKDRMIRGKSVKRSMPIEIKGKKMLKNLSDEKSNSDTESLESGAEESNGTFPKNPWKALGMEVKNLDGTSEYSLSDTDSVSKSSSSTPISHTFQDQITRQRRNNLFRGVSRDRVCQICKLPDKVLKCKGPCNGLYHYECTFNGVLKEDDLPDSTQLNGEVTDLIIRDENIKDRKTLSIAEQIDIKMKEVMQNLQNDTRYADSTTDYSSSEESNCNTAIGEKTEDDSLIIKHVTADHVSFINDSADDILLGNKKNLKIGDVDKKNEEGNEASSELNKEFQCRFCLNKTIPACYACGKKISNKNESLRQKCSLRVCGKYYHPQCLKLWPQTQWSFISSEKHSISNELLDTFVCPLHVCHTCASDDPSVSRSGSRNVAKCLRCPATYHTTNYCTPAGTQILSVSQIICPRHFVHEGLKKSKSKLRTVNTPWCFICSKGGDLICCETCPTSVHTECLTVNFLDDDTFICEDCETGRFPLYDEVVWVKLGKYRWWPAVILFPNEVPHNVKIIPHGSGEFVVKFFGTHDHYWVGRGRVFLFQEGDKGHYSPSKKRVDNLFRKSIEEATAAHIIKKTFRKNKDAAMKSVVKPPPYIRVKVNKPVGNVRQFDGNISNTTSCECNPLQENPCGPDSDCINRLLLTECDPNVCPAKEKCHNQRFEKRQYPTLQAYKTQGRGWGLKTLAPIAKGDFVIEYVGEVIDEQEYQRRIRKMHEQKDENYYFLIIDKERIIDAGPKGNLARFMNHCCEPNCETQKWTVNGDTRVGLFAIEDIPANSELTFNYNLECIGKEKKICKCGASKCSGFIGVKVKDESQKKLKKSNGVKKKKALVSEVLKNNGPCFICGENGDVGSCHNKICTKFYHLQCVNLTSWPDGKWVCPWHNCNICTKRTIRCCVKCTNSYCPVHSEGNVRYDKLLGFVCSEHDPSKEPQEPKKLNESVNKFKCSDVTEETDVTSTTCDDTEPPDPESVENLDESLTSTPVKKCNVSKSLQELKLNLVREKLEIPESSVSEETVKKANALKIKRKKRRSRKTRSHKKIKLANNSAVTPSTHFNVNNLIDVTTRCEVRLCASIPIRHLRTRCYPTKISSKRFLKQQSELEKDLPMRKRSRPRCEVTS